MINQVTAKTEAMNNQWLKPLGMGPGQKKCLAVVMTQNNKTNHAKLRRNQPCQATQPVGFGYRKYPFCEHKVNLLARLAV